MSVKALMMIIMANGGIYPASDPFLGNEIIAAVSIDGIKNMNDLSDD